MRTIPLVTTSAPGISIRFRMEHGEYTLTNRGEVAELWHFEVYPQWRGTHCARWILHQAMTDAKARGSKRMWLAVKADNARALVLFYTTGFKITAFRGDALEFEMENVL